MVADPVLLFLISVFMRSFDGRIPRLFPLFLFGLMMWSFYAVPAHAYYFPIASDLGSYTSSTTALPTDNQSLARAFENAPKNNHLGPEYFGLLYQAYQAGRLPVGEKVVFHDETGDEWAQVVEVPYSDSAWEGSPDCVHGGVCYVLLFQSGKLNVFTGFYGEQHREYQQMRFLSKDLLSSEDVYTLKNYGFWHTRKVDDLGSDRKGKYKGSYLQYNRLEGADAERESGGDKRVVMIERISRSQIVNYTPSPDEENGLVILTTRNIGTKAHPAFQTEIQAAYNNPFSAERSMKKWKIRRKTLIQGKNKLVQYADILESDLQSLYRPVIHVDGVDYVIHVSNMEENTIKPGKHEVSLVKVPLTKKSN
jgi:hypothetical protein